MQCPYCIDAYTSDCLEKGADLEQMTEAVHVAAAIRGGASLVHGVQMREHVAEAGDVSVHSPDDSAPDILRAFAERTLAAGGGPSAPRRSSRAGSRSPRPTPSSPLLDEVELADGDGDPADFDRRCAAAGSALRRPARSRSSRSTSASSAT